MSTLEESPMTRVAEGQGPLDTAETAAAEAAAAAAAAAASVREKARLANEAKVAVERARHEQRAQRFGVAVVEPRRGRVLSHTEYSMERYANRDPNRFVAGIDILAEDELKRRNVRMARFGVIRGVEDPIEDLETVRAREAHEAAQRELRRQRSERFNMEEAEEETTMAMEVDAYEPQREVEEGEQLRDNALQIYGLDTMSTGDIHRYFRDAGNPASFIEWVNDSAANVVFDDAPSAARALVTICQLPICHETGEMIRIEPFAWRKALPHPQAPALVVRYATDRDTKVLGAAAKSHFYATFGRRRGRGGGARGAGGGRRGRRRVHSEGEEEESGGGRGRKERRRTQEADEVEVEDGAADGVDGREPVVDEAGRVVRGRGRKRRLNGDGGAQDAVMGKGSDNGEHGGESVEDEGEEGGEVGAEDGDGGVRKRRRRSAGRIRPGDAYILNDVLPSQILDSPSPPAPSSTSSTATASATTTTTTESLSRLPPGLSARLQMRVGANGGDNVQ